MTKGARAVVTLLVLAVLGLSGIAMWQYLRAEKAEKQLGLDAGRVLSAVFVEARELRVGRLTGTALARSDNDGIIFHTDQETTAPFSVNYFIDLKKINHDDYDYDVRNRTMTIYIPDVTIETANIDMSKAQAKVKGWWVSREAAVNLAKKASSVLAATATARAKSDDNMTKARRSAEYAVSAFVRQPLAAAGIDDVKVEVRFPWEGRHSSEQWDRSRRPEEVLANRS